MDSIDDLTIDEDLISRRVKQLSSEGVLPLILL